ncbi:hypothetical protein MC885_019991 [Smutsia gigantea]|nr:hypothetical protein MC885_019991 [Smutsia gigantea]
MTGRAPKAVLKGPITDKLERYLSGEMWANDRSLGLSVCTREEGATPGQGENRQTQMRADGFTQHNRAYGAGLRRPRGPGSQRGQSWNRTMHPAPSTAITFAYKLHRFRTSVKFQQKALKQTKQKKSKSAEFLMVKEDREAVEGTGNPVFNFIIENMMIGDRKPSLKQVDSQEKYKRGANKNLPRNKDTFRFSRSGANVADLKGSDRFVESRCFCDSHQPSSGGQFHSHTTPEELRGYTLEDFPTKVRVRVLLGGIDEGSCCKAGPPVEPEPLSSCGLSMKLSPCNSIYRLGSISNKIGPCAIDCDINLLKEDHELHNKALWLVLDSVLANEIEDDNSLTKLVFPLPFKREAAMRMLFPNNHAIGPTCFPRIQSMLLLQVTTWVANFLCQGRATATLSSTDEGCNITLKDSGFRKNKLAQDANFCSK